MMTVLYAMLLWMGMGVCDLEVLLVRRQFLECTRVSLASCFLLGVVVFIGRDRAW
jgi:hypothetical protein